MLRAEPAVPGKNIGGQTMIKKYIENTEEIRQRLTRMLMDDASDMCRYQRDIYMYIDEDGQAQLDWFVNVGGNSWIDDDHFLLYVCRQHYEGIEDSIEGTAMLADILGLTDAELADVVCLDYEIKREDLDADDCFRWAFDRFGDRLREWYEECIEDAASDYEDEADEILRSFCRKSIDVAGWIEDTSNTVPIVWLFVIDDFDQRALDKQRGGDGND